MSLDTLRRRERTESGWRSGPPHRLPGLRGAQRPKIGFSIMRPGGFGTQQLQGAYERKPVTKPECPQIKRGGLLKRQAVPGVVAEEGDVGLVLGLVAEKREFDHGIGSGLKFASPTVRARLPGSGDALAWPGVCTSQGENGPDLAVFDEGGVTTGHSHEVADRDRLVVYLVGGIEGHPAELDHDSLHGRPSSWVRVPCWR